MYYTDVVVEREELYERYDFEAGFHGDMPWKESHPALAQPAPELTRQLPLSPASSLFGSGLSFKPSQSNGTLVFHLTNTGNPDPLRECRVYMRDFKIWSLSQKTFVLIREFDKDRSNLLPILIHGPDDLYVDQPTVCHFIETTNNKELSIRSVEPKNAAPVAAVTTKGRYLVCLPAATDITM